MIAQASVSDQIGPFDDFDDAPEFPLKLVDTAPAIRRRPPGARMNVKAADNIRDDIAIKNAIIRDASPTLLEIFDLPVPRAVCD